MRAPFRCCPLGEFGREPRTLGAVPVAVVRWARCPGRTIRSPWGTARSRAVPENRQIETGTAPVVPRGQRRAGRVPRRRREHGAMQQRTRAAHAAHAVHRPPVEVADPHRDGESAGHAHGPVVGEVPAGAGLRGHGKGEVERRLDAESRDAGDRVVEDVEHQRGASSRSRSRRPGATAAARGRGASSATGATMPPLRERPVAVGELEQRHVAVAEREAEAVVLGAPAERGEAGLAQHAGAGCRSPGDRPARRRAGCTSWPGLRGPAPGRGSGGRSSAAGTGRWRSGTRAATSGRIGRGRVAAVERERVEERLERGAGLARRHDHVHLPRRVGPEIGRADPGEHLAGGVVQHDGRGLARAAVGQGLDGVAHLGLERELKRQVERRPHRRRAGAAGASCQRAAGW